MLTITRNCMTSKLTFSWPDASTEPSAVVSDMLGELYQFLVICVSPPVGSESWSTIARNYHLI